jgi:hypothetical protein
MSWRTAALTAALIGVCVGGGLANMEQPDIRGTWHTETYLLKDGTKRVVKGHIFFAAREWTVLFFIVDEANQPASGSAEGGTYSQTGDEILLRHVYHMSSAKAVAGPGASPFRLQVHDVTRAPEELCRVEVNGDVLTLRFPSGNAMLCRRASGF